MFARSFPLMNRMGTSALDVPSRGTNGVFDPPDHMVVSDLERLKAISDPLRMRVVEELAVRERSVTELAEAMATTRHRLYYHIRILEKLDLIVQTGSRMVSGTEERLYRAAARSFVISHALSPTLLSGTVTGMFQQSLREVQQAVVQPHDEAYPQVEVIRGAGELTQAQHAVFVEKLKQLFVELEAGTRDDEQTRRYGLLVAMAPVLDSD